MQNNSEVIVGSIKQKDNPLNTINTEELLKNIEEWGKLDLFSISDMELTNKIINTLSVYMATSSILNNEKLYRVRPLKDCIQYVDQSEIWYPPENYVNKMGRINSFNESVLYCSLDMNSPINEMKINKNEWFSLIQYSVQPNRKLHLANIIQNNMPNGLDINGRINYMIINNFISSEFTKPVGEGTEYLYRITKKIASDLFNIPLCDGWLYPSVASFLKGYNVALKKEAVDKIIHFDSMLVCRLESFDANKKEYKISVHHKADSIVNMKLVYEF